MCVSGRVAGLFSLTKGTRLGVGGRSQRKDEDGAIRAPATLGRLPWGGGPQWAWPVLWVRAPSATTLNAKALLLPLAHGVCPWQELGQNSSVWSRSGPSTRAGRQRLASTSGKSLQLFLFSACAVLVCGGIGPGEWTPVLFRWSSYTVSRGRIVWM